MKTVVVATGRVALDLYLDISDIYKIHSILFLIITPELL